MLCGYILNDTLSISYTRCYATHITTADASMHLRHVPIDAKNTSYTHLHTKRHIMSTLKCMTEVLKKGFMRYNGLYN